MRLRRAIVSSVILAVLVSFSAACGGGSQSFSDAQRARAAEADAAAAAKARARAAAQEKAAAAERRRAAIEAEMRRRAASTTTSTTAPATPTTPTTPTAPTTPTVPIDRTPADLATVRRALDRLNTAFRAGIAAGIAHSESINYWVDTGVYTARQCAAFEAARGGGVVRESLAVRPGTFAPDPGWIDPVVGTKPSGRVYSLVVDDLQTLVPSGEQRRVSFPIHATVLGDGRALLFLRCA